MKERNVEKTKITKKEYLHLKEIALHYQHKIKYSEKIMFIKLKLFGKIIYLHENLTSYKTKILKIF